MNDITRQSLILLCIFILTILKMIDIAVFLIKFLKGIFG